MGDELVVLLVPPAPGDAGKGVDAEDSGGGRRRMRMRRKEGRGSDRLGDIQCCTAKSCDRDRWDGTREHAG
eukprot:768767-Hanusia_phi.AAC.7